MIIFDLGGVLLQEAEANLSESLSHLDVERVDGKPKKIFFRMFEFADLIFNKECKREYLIGNILGSEIAKKIKECIDKKEYEFFFKNSQEKTLIKYGCELILLPEKEVSLTLLDLKGLEFVKKCKKNGLRIMILSNWNPDSLDLVRNKFPELFNLFKQEDIVIPAHVGAIKPEIEIFKYVIKKFNLDTVNTFFVDDSPKNVSAAQACGLKSIVHRNWEQTEQALMLNGLKISSDRKIELTAS